MANVEQESSGSRPYFRAGHIAFTRNPGLIDTQRLLFISSGRPEFNRWECVSIIKMLD
jgi:hypothetical protein